MSTFVGFELMPALNEGDEHVSLEDILALRDCHLVEAELWAVCQECCSAIQNVHNSCEMFQTLCISPESLAFDSAGFVCFLDLPSDPEILYIPPEYETVGNSDKAHLYSLGMTLLYAAEYNAGTRRDMPPLSEDFRQMIGQMTADEYEERISLDTVVEMCKKHLAGRSSDKICYELASVGRLESSVEGDASSILSIGSLQSLPSLSRTDSPSLGEPGASSPGASSPGADSGKTTPTSEPGAYGPVREIDGITLNKTWLTEADIKKITTSLSDSELRKIACNASVLRELGEQGNSCYQGRGPFLEKLLLMTKGQLSECPDQVVEDEETLEKLEESVRIDVGRSPAEPEPDGNPQSTESPFSFNIQVPEDVIKSANDAGQSSSPVPSVSVCPDGEPNLAAGTVTEQQVVGSEPSSWSVEGSGVCPASSGLRWRVNTSHHQGPGGRSSSPISQGHQPRTVSPHKATVTYDSLFRQRDSKNGADPKDPSTPPQHPQSGEDRNLNASDSLPGILPLEGSDGGLYKENETSVTDWMMESQGKEELGINPPAENIQNIARSSWKPPTDPAASEEQGQSIREILDKLECGLHENELWSLCRESVLALHKYRDELPAYISLETVVVEDTGHISYRPVPEDRELEVVYLAPELQQHGVVTQKTCLFGIAAMLWSAADYKLPPNQEPALSDELESLLISMTQDDVASRPGVPNVLRACNAYERRQEVSSSMVCKALAVDARKAQEFGKSNTLVQNILDKVAEDHHSQLMNSIKGLQLQDALKPVSERQLKEKDQVLTLHDKLMAEICQPNRKLRKSSKPKILPVAEIFLNSPELMAGLMRVTGKQRQVASFHRAKSPRHVHKTPEVPDPSAFNSLPRRSANLVKVGTATGTMPRNNSASPARVPSAFTSNATHFKPIVLTVQTSKEKEMAKSVLNNAIEHRDKKVAQKLQELKKNLMKNRLPLSLAQDIENEPGQQGLSNPVSGDEGWPDRKPTPVTSSSNVPSPHVTSPATSLPPHVPSASASDSRVQNSPHVPFSTPPSVPESHVSPHMHMLQGAVPPSSAFPQGHGPFPQGQTAFSHSQYSYAQSQGAFPHAQGTFPHAPGIIHPPQGFHNGHHPLSHGMNSLNQSPYGYLSPPPSSGGQMYPMQMQFQQDPRTGMFHMVPIMMPGVMTHAPSPISPVSGIQSPPVHSPPVQSPPIQSPPVQSPPIQSPPEQSLPVQSPPPIQSPPVSSPPSHSPPVQSPPVSSASSSSLTSQDAPNTSISSTDDPIDTALVKSASERNESESGPRRTARYIKNASKERARYREAKIRSKSESASADRERENERRVREKSRESDREEIGGRWERGKSIEREQEVIEYRRERGKSREREQENNDDRRIRAISRERELGDLEYRRERGKSREREQGDLEYGRERGKSREREQGDLEYRRERGKSREREQGDIEYGRERGKSREREQGDIEYRRERGKSGEREHGEIEYGRERGKSREREQGDIEYGRERGKSREREQGDLEYRRERGKSGEREQTSHQSSHPSSSSREKFESRRSHSQRNGYSGRYRYRTHYGESFVDPKEDIDLSPRERSRGGRPVQRTKSSASRSRSQAVEIYQENTRQSRLKKASSEELLDNIESKDDSQVPVRRREDTRTRLKRAKSGSSIDYRNLALEIKAREIQVDHSQSNYSSHSLARSHKNNMSKSQPNLDYELSPVEMSRVRHAQNTSGPRSPLRSPLDDGQSPPPSPSLSKDSGVSGLNLRTMNGSGEISLMERLLSSDTIRHQQKLSKVIRLLRDEFAFDGYMENGIEDLAMANGLQSVEAYNAINTLGALQGLGTSCSTPVRNTTCDWGNGQYFKPIQWDPFTELNTNNNLYVQANTNDTFAHPIGDGFYYDPEDGNIYMDPAFAPYYKFEQNPEYVLSLGNLKWETFNNAITEKYCDLYWQEDLLLGLYESVNGLKPSNGEKMQVDKTEAVNPHWTGSQYSPRQCAPQESYQPEDQRHHQMNGHVRMDSHSESSHPLVRDTYDSSAFRPIRTNDRGRGLNNEAPIYKPKPMMAPKFSNDTSDSTESEAEERRWRFKKKTHIEKMRSNSMHNLLPESHLQAMEINVNGLSKSHSQGAITISPSPASPNTETEGEQSPCLSSPVLPMTPVEIETPKPRLIHVRSSESENEVFVSNIVAKRTGNVLQKPKKFTPAQRAKSQSSGYLYRYDSDSSTPGDWKQPSRRTQNDQKPMGQFERQKGLRMAHRSVSRDESISSRSSSQCSNHRLVGARSESHLHMLSDGSESDSSRGRQPSFTSVSSVGRLHKGCVAYYSAELEERIQPEIKDFARQVDTRTKESIEIKMADLDQQMMMEHRMKKKTLKFYQKLMEGSRLGKASGEQKSMLAKMSKQIGEMNDKLEFLDAAKKHLEMLYAEHWGLDHSLLFALTMCPGDQPMLLAPNDNPCLQYQVVKVMEGHRPGSNHEGYILQAGTPEGLMAYLFAQEALSDGFIHQFFFCFRYFATPRDLFNFLCDKFTAAALSLSPDAQVPMKVKARSVDLFQVWIEGYYCLDFRHNLDLARELFTFVKDKVIPADSSAEHLLDLLEDCQDGRHADLFYPQFALTEDMELELLQAQQHTPRKWESFKAALHLSAKPVKIKQPVRSKVSCVDKRTKTMYESEAYYPKVGARRSDGFTLADYTSQNMAEQLTMMEQEMFRNAHPVHFLNSRAQGVGVELTNPILNKAHSTQRLNTAWEDNQDQSLFVGDFTLDDTIQRMIEYSQTLSFWAAGEIVCCTSSKMQVGVLSKFIYTAKICHELRNYASCVSIIDALENVIVRQVPAWRNLPSKSIAMMEELSAIKVFLKADSMCLSGNKDGPRLPTIPCVLLFLLHVQQLEIGGFTLANGMYKWAKMKTIGKVIDQIRVFKEQSYAFEIDRELQQCLRQRMTDLAQQDLHVLAAQYDTNFTKMASSGLFQGALRRMRGKLAGKAD